MFSTLYNEAPAVYTWLRGAPSSYKQWLIELRNTEIKTLKTSSDEVELHRSQGRLDLLDRFMELENELKQKGH